MRLKAIYRRLTFYAYSQTKAVRNHYETLEIPVSCSFEEVKQSYLKQSKLLHPDVNIDKSTREFIELQQSYNILSDPYARKLYDSHLGIASLWETPQGNPHFKNEELYETLNVNKPAFRKDMTMDSILHQAYGAAIIYSWEDLLKAGVIPFGLFAITWLTWTTVEIFLRSYKGIEDKYQEQAGTNRKISFIPIFRR